MNSFFPTRSILISQWHPKNAHLTPADRRNNNQVRYKTGSTRISLGMALLILTGATFRLDNNRFGVTRFHKRQVLWEYTLEIQCSKHYDSSRLFGTGRYCFPPVVHRRAPDAIVDLVACIISGTPWNQIYRDPSGAQLPTSLLPADEFSQPAQYLVFNV